ncbi:MAG: N-acetylmuramoyl-L-alanine amidase [Myxococcales bacterium]|nr:N-acetylmuramoyl-L-alanine amidase [Myxococcales bacterium]
MSLLAAWTAGLLAASVVGCGRRAAGSTEAGDAGAAEMADWARARSVIEGRGPAADRAELLGLAGRFEVRADREGGGARAVSLRSMAARLVEAAWRAGGRDEDGQRALDLYGAATRNAAVPGACDAALRGAQLAGDSLHDAREEYAALYRAQRRFSSAPGADAGATAWCLRDVDDELRRLVLSRPPRRVLEAIDEELEAEGEVAAAGPWAAPGGRAEDAGGTAAVISLEAWPGRDAARVVIVLDRPAAFRVGEEEPSSSPAAGAARVVVDLDRVRLGSFGGETRGEGLLRRTRAEPTDAGTRVSLELDSVAYRHVFELQDPFRVVVDVARRPPEAPADAPRAVSRLVLDPGHGGSDHGARDPGGLEEKDVVLDIARRVAPVFAGQGIDVVLTRDDDQYVSLEERTALANNSGADLFVSIHCNASESHAPRGVEMYVLDVARDEIATRVAARENDNAGAVGGEVGSILGGLRVADGARRSRRLAQLMLRAATTAVKARYGDVVNGGVHTAGFYVLVGARMPAVLFETSYISNPVEGRRLATPEYRQILADAIVNGIRAYREGR